MEKDRSRMQAFTDIILRTDPARFKTRQEVMDFFAEQGFTEEEVGRYLAVQVGILTRAWNTFAGTLREKLQPIIETVLTVFNSED